MGWILLESLVALLLAVFIVWWTMSGTRKHTPPSGRPAGSDPRSSDPDRAGVRHDDSGRNGEASADPGRPDPKR